MKLSSSRPTRARVLGLAVALASGPAAASSVYGPLANFDVVNDTGHDTCGFEIEIEGVHSAEVYRTFHAPSIRYEAPTLTDTATGVLIHYEGVWDAGTQTFLQSTPPAAPGYVPRSDSCWTVGLGNGYPAAGCEHFGVSHTTQATSTRYRWLSCNPDGTTSALPDLGLPAPVWSVSPPANPADPPVVRAEIEIPNPEGAPYGDPYWVKIYKTEAAAPAVLEDLLMENEQVANAETEIEWEILQAKPGQELALNEAPLGAGAEAVIRRYEFYHYNTAWGRTHTYIDPDTGQPVPYVDPENGEVVECVVDGCNDPTPDELGGYIGRQIAGFNIAPPGSACSNGVDDDGDGLADFPDDPGCETADDLDERSPLLVCDDGADNDGDGGVDYDPATYADPSTGTGDPGCASPTAATESPSCQDGANNDEDGLVDFDGGQSIHGACLGGVCPQGVSDPDGDGVADPDPECTSRPWRNTEGAAACGLGFELSLLLPALMRLRRRRTRSS